MATNEEIIAQGMARLAQAGGDTIKLVALNEEVPIEEAFESNILEIEKAFMEPPAFDPNSYDLETNNKCFFLVDLEALGLTMTKNWPDVGGLPNVRAFERSPKVINKIGKVMEVILDTATRVYNNR